MRGPDGVNYAVSGEVSIDVGPAATPQETLLKAQIVRRAALAPAEPSAQDRNVAAEAVKLEAQARLDLAEERQAEMAERLADNSDVSPTENAVETEPQPIDVASQPNTRSLDRIIASVTAPNTPGQLFSGFA